MRSFKLIFFVALLCIWSLRIRAAQCPSGKYPVRAHTRTDYYRHDGTYVSGTNVSESCREYRTLKPLIIKFSQNMPKGWPHKKEKFRRWTEKEKSDITKALNELPAVLTQIGELKIYRAIKSEIPDNPGTSAPEEKIITLYDSISKHELKRVLVHELAHIYYASFSKDELESYYQAAQWKFDKSENIYVTDRKSFLVADSKIGPEEDFSNNIEYFYFKKADIEKEQNIYNWIKKMVGEE